MDLLIQGRKMSLTDSIRSYAQEKMSRASDRARERVSMRLSLGSDGLSKQACASIHIKGRDLQISARDQTLYGAIDKLSDAVAVALVRDKEKKGQARWRSRGAKEDLAEGFAGQGRTSSALLAASTTLPGEALSDAQSMPTWAAAGGVAPASSRGHKWRQEVWLASLDESKDAAAWEEAEVINVPESQKNKTRDEMLER